MASRPAPPPIRTPEDFVQALGDAVEDGKLPGIFGLDDHGKAGEALVVELVSTEERLLRVTVEEVPRA